MGVRYWPLILLLVGCSCAPAPKSTAPPPPPPSGGDSILTWVEGDSISTENFYGITSWPQLTGWIYRNFAVPGSGIDGVAQRLVQNAEVYGKPRDVYLMIGSNDAQGNRPMADQIAWFEYINAWAASGGITIHWIMPPYTADRPPSYNTWLAWWNYYLGTNGALDCGPLLGNPLQYQYTVDGVHPNNAGHVVLHDCIVK